MLKTLEMMELTFLQSVSNSSPTVSNSLPSEHSVRLSFPEPLEVKHAQFERKNRHRVSGPPGIGRKQKKKIDFLRDSRDCLL